MMKSDHYSCPYFREQILSFEKALNGKGIEMKATFWGTSDSHHLFLYLEDNWKLRKKTLPVKWYHGKRRKIYKYENGFKRPEPSESKQPFGWKWTISIHIKS